MKALINKIIKNSVAIVIFCIVVYGNVYATKVCCKAILKACIPTSNSSSVSFNIDNYSMTSLSYHINNQPLSNIHSINFIADFGSGNTCCETDHCDNYNQINYIRPSYNQGSHLAQNDVRSISDGNGTRTAFRPFRLSTSFKAVPIYIATQSILC